MTNSKVSKSEIKNLKKIKKFFEIFSISHSEFHLILIGKDRGIKFNSRNTSLEGIILLIDTMPMLQEEILNDKC